MFETYLNLTNRNAKNARLLTKYQPDIDALSAHFSEADLLGLMLITDSNGITWMKPASGIVNVISPTAAKSNQINFFQNTAVLKKWCALQSEEFRQLAIKIYARKTARQNKIPEKITEQLDLFIKTQLDNAETGTLPLLKPFLKILAKMLIKKTFRLSAGHYPDGKNMQRSFERAINHFQVIITEHLCSDAWVNNLPEIKSLTPAEVSRLIFSHFCSEFLFNFIFQTLDGMIKARIVVNGTLHHPKMVPLILFTMLPYEVAQSVISREGYTTTLTSPDVFIVKNTLHLGKANLTGYTKNTEQLIRKTYIYIALLLHPDWDPTSKEIGYFIEGNKYSEVKGFLKFPPITNAKTPSPRSMINDITLLSKENYIEKFMAMARNK